MKKAATGLSCGGFTPSIATNKRGAAVQSTESKDTPRMTETGRLIGPKEAIAIDTAPFSGLDQHYYQLWLRGSDTIDGLEAALAAERDRADRAELELNAVTSLDVDHFTDIWDSLPRVSYTTRVAMAQAAVELIKQATA